MMKISIIVVSWNTKPYLSDCIESLLRSILVDHEIIVVDNASGDGTADIIEERFPQVRLIANSVNRGFAAACNQGLEAAKGRYVLFLNPDTLWMDTSMERLAAFMDANPEIGICGPKILNADGTLQPSARRYPTFRGALHRHTIFKFFRIFKKYADEWRYHEFNYEVLNEAEQLIGACLLAPRELIVKFGGMDERFFMYYEEVDLCLRIRQAGKKVMYWPDWKIVHLGGKSAEQIPAEKEYMRLLSLLKFFRKYRGRLTTVLFFCLFFPANILRNLTELIAYNLAMIYAMLFADEREKTKYRKKIETIQEFLLFYIWKLTAYRRVPAESYKGSNIKPEFPPYERLMNTGKIRCNLCDADDCEVVIKGKDRLHGVTGEFYYVRCRQCGLVFMNPQLSVEELKKYYPTDYRAHVIRKPKGSAVYKWTLNPQFQNLCVSLNNKSKLLDVGCGIGVFLNEVKNTSGCEVFGVDISENAVKAAKKLYGIDIFQGTITDAKFENEYFDAISAWEYLEHVNNPMEVLTEICRILKPGGIFMLSCPNYASFNARVFKDKWYHLDCPRHLYLYTPKTISSLLKKSGFSGIETRYRKSSKGMLGSLQYLFYKNNCDAKNRGKIIKSKFLKAIVSPISRMIDLTCNSDSMVICAKK